MHARGVALVCLLAGCSGIDGNSKRDATRAYVKEVTGLSDDDLAAGGGGLRVTVRDVTSDGRIATIRGRVENGYREPVEGVRYVVGFFAAGDPPRLLGTYQHEVDTTIEPGDATSITIEAESMYLSGTGRFGVAATPVKLGGRDIPPPPEWK
jgi:hypothetical protein